MAEKQHTAHQPGGTVHLKNMFEVLHEFPRLTTSGMIAQDFHILHQDEAPKLFEKWLVY